MVSLVLLVLLASTILTAVASCWRLWCEVRALAGSACRWLGL